ncbi:MAG: EthD domain-containing protein [bacterium]
MPKSLALIRRAEGADRKTFGADFLAFGRELAKRPDVEHCTINLVDIPAEEAGLRPGGEPTFDVVAELWTETSADPVALLSGPGAPAGQCNVYAVDEKVERPYDRDWPDGERSPGVKSFFLALRHPQMTHEQFADYWGGQHAPLALKIHIGMWRYTRNVVSKALTADAPDWDGMAILHFRSAFDLRERFYDSEEGRAAIAADVAKFSGGGRALHSSEWILK